MDKHYSLHYSWFLVYIGALSFWSLISLFLAISKRDLVSLLALFFLLAVLLITYSMGRKFGVYFKNEALIVMELFRRERSFEPGDITGIYIRRGFINRMFGTSQVVISFNDPKALANFKVFGLQTAHLGNFEFPGIYADRIYIPALSESNAEVLIETLRNFAGNDLPLERLGYALLPPYSKSLTVAAYLESIILIILFILTLGAVGVTYLYLKYFLRVGI